MKEITKVWMEYVKRDITAAHNLLEDEFVANIVLFHSQQAVEKALKAVLEEYGTDIPKTHSLMKLYFLVQEPVKQILDVDQKSLKLLEDIYIDQRYPGEIGILPNGFPTKRNAENVYGISSTIVNQIIEFLENKI